MNIYDEYNAVYSSIPICVLVIERNGAIKEYNPKGKELIESLYNKPISSFNLLKDSNLIDEDDLDKALLRQIEKTITLLPHNNESEQECKYIKLTLSSIESEDSVSFSVLISNETNIIKEKQELDQINNVYNKALTQSRIGVCSLNLFDNKGFATGMWYNNLFSSSSLSVIESLANIVAEDYKYIEEYINDIKNIQFNEEAFLEFTKQNYKKHLNCNVKIISPKGRFHHLLIVAEVSSYNPENGEIIIELLNMNIDDQKEREAVLENTYLKTQETEDLKSKLVSNLSSLISIPLNTITESCRKLLISKEKHEEKLLFEKIELSTKNMLNLVSDIVENSKGKSIHRKSNNTSVKTLLIAEDSTNNAQLIKYMIKDKYKIVHALNGEEAVLMFREIKPNAVLMDLDMPKTDGYQATAIIRENKDDTPIIAMMAKPFGKEIDKDSLINKGFNNYISKPINEMELMNMLKQYL